MTKQWEQMMITTPDKNKNFNRVTKWAFTFHLQKLQQTMRKGKANTCCNRGPAIITHVRTPTTYDLEYRDHNYSRATSELRPYRSRNTQWPAPLTIDDVSGEIKVGEFVAYLQVEQQQDNHYHIGKVSQLGDDLIIDSFVTTSKSEHIVKWKSLEQIVTTTQYTLEKMLKDTKYKCKTTSRQTV